MCKMKLLSWTGAIMLLTLLMGCTGEVDTAVSTLPLTDCLLPGDQSALCGTLSVPENRDVTNGRMLNIHIAVVPAESSTPESDPVFMLAGGPGQAAAEAYPLILPIFDDLAQNRDIVLVDQRGTGQSNPLECPNLQALPLDTPDETVFELIEACRQSLAQTANLTQYITDIAMQDLDEVREALGYEQINLIGTSYGTRAALSYMRLFPNRVRSVVLNAVTSPELVLQLQAPADGQRSLELLFDRCRSDAACSETFPEFERQFKEIAAALGEGQPVTYAHPVTGQQETIELSEEILMGAVFNLLYSPDLLSLLPLLTNDVAQTEDYGPLVAQIIALSSSFSLYQGMFYAVTCSEDAPLLDEGETAVTNPKTLFPSGAVDFAAICQTWPQAEDPNAFRQPLTSSISTLLLSGEADPITPPVYAEQVAGGLSNSRHIILPGYGHDIMTVGCIPTVITNFVASGTVANLDTSCIDEITPPPFFVSPSGPKP